MKKIIVSTYCEWTSIGSMLQAFALNKILLNLGYDELLIKKKSIRDDNPIIYLKNSSIKNVYSNLSTFFNKDKIMNSYQKNREFIKSNFKIYEYTNYNCLCNDIPIADAYIAGSDQIWHPNIHRLDFYLDFAPKESRKISYAASMGIETIKTNQIDFYKDSLNKFDYISVREVNAKNVLERMLNREVHQHVDPTFLIKEKEWEKYEKPRNIKGKYILVYLIYRDKNINKQIKKLKKDTGYDIVNIYTGTKHIYNDHTFYDVDPNEFLWLIHNAEMVITSSFHGTVFSIIYNKKFFALINPNSKSRISNLLNIFDIPNNSFEESFSINIDYDKVNSIIDLERARSIKYLQEAIENE